jgi:hypothetical protein
MPWEADTFIIPAAAEEKASVKPDDELALDRERRHAARRFFHTASGLSRGQIAVPSLAAGGDQRSMTLGFTPQLVSSASRSTASWSRISAIIVLVTTVR